MAKCPYCGRTLEKDERYCYFCHLDVGKVKDEDERPQIPRPNYYNLKKEAGKLKNLLKGKRSMQEKKEMPQKERGYLYFLDKDGDVARVKMARGREPGKKKQEKVLKMGIKRKEGLLYYIGKNLEVKTAPMKQRPKR